MTIRRRFSQFLGPSHRVFIGSLGTRFVLLGIGFVTSIALARLYGPVSVAQMSLLVSLLVVTGHLSLFGSQMAILKRLPELKDPIEVARTIGTAYLITLLLAFIVSGFLTWLILSGWLGTYASQLGQSFILFLPLVVFFNAFRILTNETLRGLHRIYIYNVIIIVNALLLLIIVWSFWAIGQQVIHMPWVIFATEGIIFLATFVHLFGGGRGMAIRLPSGSGMIYSHLRFSSVYFISSSSVLVGQVDILMAGGIVPLAQLGFYAVAIRIASLAGLALISANVSFAPRLAGVFVEDGLDSAISLAHAQTRIVVPLTLIMGTVLAVLGYPLLLVYGPDFVEAYPVLLVLLVGQVGTVIFGPVGVFLNMSFGHREMVFVTILELGVAFIGCILLIPDYGILGAAMANSAAQITRGISATAFLYWRTGTTITIFHALREKVTV